MKADSLRYDTHHSAVPTGSPVGTADSCPKHATPKISIVVPVLNEEKILESVLSRYTPRLLSRWNAELIVSDGGSTDATVAIATAYASTVVRHTLPHRQTIAEGRNCGAAVATGHILVFINGDTVPADAEAFFRAVVSWWHANPTSPALACPVGVDPRESRPSDTAFHAFFNRYVRLLNFIGLGMGRGECQVIRAESFRSVGGYNPAIAAGEDFDLYRRLARLGAIAHSDEALVWESPRRFRRYGYTRVLVSWTVNAVAVMLFRKAVSKEWEAVR